MSEFGAIHRQMVKAASAAPYLSRSEERDLARRWRDEGDEEALHLIASSHIRLVLATASRFRHYGLPFADLVQEGSVGLLEAAARFEPGRDVRFSTYACWWIRAAIQDFVLRNWSIVRGGTSSAQKSLFFNLRRLRAQLAHLAFHDPSVDVHGRIAASIGVARSDVEIMDMRLSGQDTSLNSSSSGRESQTASERQDYLIDAAPLPDEIASDSIDAKRRADWVRRALALLSDRERLIITARQFNEGEVATLDAIGRRLGISKERVRQIENRALVKLRKALLSDHAEAFIASA
jgi:RNA polymerase sigma-32 factor